MAFSAQAVANEFLLLARRDSRSLDPMQLQKLVYFAHGWHLALTGRPLIREKVEAWPFGPVIPTLFHEFKRWGSGAIQEPAMRGRLLGGVKIGSHPASLDEEATVDEDLATAKRVIERVWDVYGRFSGVKLSEMTHQPSSPWFEARRAHPGERDVEIPNESMKRFFAHRIDRERDAAAHAG